MRLKRLNTVPFAVNAFAIIDVFLVVLVFFLLTVRMQATASLTADPAIAEGASKLGSGGLLITMSATGDIGIDDIDLLPNLALVTIANRLQDQPGLRLRIEADKNAALGTLLPFIKEIEKLGPRDMVFVTTPEAA